jgi:molybdate transport system ATP-binding protein
MKLLDTALAVTSRDVEVDLALEPGEVLALLGPNGAGKSTVLSVLAGLLPADRGHLTLAGRDLWRTPPHRRRIATLGQRALLFPHLTLRANAAFGPRAIGFSRSDSVRRAERYLTLCGVAEYADRRPQEISGGQAQRAALARALAAEPELLLLDEPFAALDTEVAPPLRRLVRDMLVAENRAAIIVTHDLLDALALADRVMVLEDGRVAERGSVTEVLSRPRSRFGARFAGVNLVAGVMAGGRLRAGSTMLAGLGELADGTPALALFRPAAVAVHPEIPHGSPRNAVPVTITALEAHGQGVRVDAHHPDLGHLAADVTPAAAAELGIRPGRRVWFAVKAQEVELLARH